MFFSAHLKQSLIISNKHGTYELAHQLPSNLKLRIVGNYEIAEKSHDFIGL